MNPGTKLPPLYGDRATLVAGARRAIETVKLTEASITRTRVDAEGDLIEVYTTIWSRQAAALERPVKSLWLFQYVVDGDELILKKIEPIELDGQPQALNEIYDRLPSPGSLIESLTE
jgi:hypothetical protein